jgi:nicotinate-nucleotide pyrophosphorylase (carboxylating)
MHELISWLCYRQAGAGADIVMLDNFKPPALKQAAAEIKKQFPYVLIEASGVSSSTYIYV